jgi:hypothetical protein
LNKNLFGKREENSFIPLDIPVFDVLDEVDKTCLIEPF